MFTLTAVLTTAALTAAPAPTFADQVLSAQLIVEGEAPSNEKGVTDWRRRAVKQVLLGDASGVKLAQPALPTACAARGTVRWLVLYTRDAKGRLAAVRLEQQAAGRGLSVEASYEQLLEAVTVAARFHEERMRATGVEQLWAEERAALKHDNPYLRTLAARFLATHGAGDVVDATWGAPGSAARKAEEASAALPAPACAR
jgi:hypothetical protein